MKQLFFAVLTLFIITTIHAQKEEKLSYVFKYKNSVQLGLMGHGAFYSVNYERVLLNYSRFKTTAEIGAGYYPDEIAEGLLDVYTLWMPVMINNFYSLSPTLGHQNIEAGIGHVFIRDRHFSIAYPRYYGLKKWYQGYAVFKIGYRYQKPEGRMIFRIYYSPFIEYYVDFYHGGNIGYRDFHHWGGISIGYAF